MKKKKISILLGDDHNVLRQGIAQVLESRDDLEVVAQASNGREVVELTRLHKPDIALLDINMPELDGLEATRIIHSEFPEIGIIILTMHRRDDYIFEAIMAGASGYLLKEVEMAELLSAVRRVAAGEAVIDPSIAARVLDEIRGGRPQSKKGPVDEVAERDQEILRLLAQGLSNQQIADQLHLSEKTVRNRLSLVFRQLHVSNRTEAALFALREGLGGETEEKEKKD
jgi:NarL family two-component system response regulator LiaR